MTAPRWLRRGGTDRRANNQGAEERTAIRPLHVAGVGVAAGFLSGLFGVGGGILIVPGLILFLRLTQRLAHGTSLAAVLPIALSGVVGYALDDTVDWPVAAFLSAGSVGGALIGTRLLRILPGRALGSAFAVLLLATALRLVFDQSDAAGRGDIDATMALGIVLLGVLSGTLAGLLGVGGGIVMVPAQVVLLSIPAAVAKGTSLAVMIPTAISATERNLRNHNADLRVAAVVGVSGVVSAFVASKISIGLDERLSNRLFAALLIVIAVRMAIVAVRRERQPPNQPVESVDPD
ncbi:MAG: sulfite exporter TauE/SafE family protein [Acidimicrobiales bacterium]